MCQNTGEESFSHTVLTFPTGEQKEPEGMNFNFFFFITSLVKMEPEAAIISTFPSIFQGILEQPLRRISSVNCPLIPGRCPAIVL